MEQRARGDPNAPPNTQAFREFPTRRINRGVGEFSPNYELDVLGHPAEPICTYYRCHHKFSLHGSGRCRCKHPMNKTLGIQVRYL